MRALKSYHLEGYRWLKWADFHRDSHACAALACKNTPGLAFESFHHFTCVNTPRSIHQPVSFPLPSLHSLSWIHTHPTPPSHLSSPVILNESRYTHHSPLNSLKQKAVVSRRGKVLIKRECQSNPGHESEAWAILVLTHTKKHIYFYFKIPLCFISPWLDVADE